MHKLHFTPDKHVADMSSHKSKVSPYRDSVILYEPGTNDPEQKRKPNEDSNRDREATVDTSKPSAVFVPKEGRSHTLSIALPGSIIAK